MTRLAIVHTESSCGWGGQELRIIAESAGFLERGHEVCLAAPEESRIHAEARRRGIPTVGLPIARKSPRGFAAMRRLLAARAGSVVNTHSSTDSWLTALAGATLARAPRIVRTRHISAPIPRNPATRWLYRRATAHVVTTGEALREQVMRETGLSPQRVSSVPTGIDLDRFCPGDRAASRCALELPETAFIVGIVATLRSWKGHRYLLDAFAKLAGGGSLLAIVGDGPGAGNLRRQIAELALGERVLITGDQEDVVPWLRALDVFALPSYANEGAPQAIMQAQACAIPVVSTRIGAIGEIVEEGKTGLLVAPRDSGALAQALERLRADPALRTGLAQAGLDQARKRYSAAAMIERMEKIFLGVLAPDAA